MCVTLTKTKTEVVTQLSYQQWEPIQAPATRTAETQYTLLDILSLICIWLLISIDIFLFFCLCIYIVFRMYIFIMGLCTVSLLLLSLEKRKCIRSLDCTAIPWEKSGHYRPLNSKQQSMKDTHTYIQYVYIYIYYIYIYTVCVMSYQLYIGQFHIAILSKILF